MNFEIVVIGASLGGLNALEVILSELPRNFPVAVAIAQHRHKFSDGELVDYLQEKTLLPVIEVEDKQPIIPGRVFLAPANYHLLVEPGYFSLSTDAPVTYARPSIDVLFESAADVYRTQVIGIILTGANNDGAIGLAKIQVYGGTIIVQKPDTAECPIMPEAAIKAVKMPQILPLSEIVPFLNSQIGFQVLN
ncbi:chemotaxis protein CheB [Aerosakkonemataceae cyanobacterium BLCC-F154]|uniref:protein-glutamate methylesterase n=1 Tax=Floridaenema fluviatile BLCC-F154 TaxID=3153640 RepID=A0ABV4YID7_9CYAN